MTVLNILSSYLETAVYNIAEYNYVLCDCTNDRLICVGPA